MLVYTESYTIYRGQVLLKKTVWRLKLINVKVFTTLYYKYYIILKGYCVVTPPPPNTFSVVSSGVPKQMGAICPHRGPIMFTLTSNPSSTTC